MIGVRHAHPEFAADAPFEVIVGRKDAPFVFMRGDLMVMVNPSEKPKNLDFVGMAGFDIGFDCRKLLGIGDVDFTGMSLYMGGQSFAIFKKGR